LTPRQAGDSEGEQELLLEQVKEEAGSDSAEVGSAAEEAGDAVEEQVEDGDAAEVGGRELPPST